MINIVPPEQIPKLDEIKEVPLETQENLLDAYKLCLQLEELCDKLGGEGIAAVQVGIPSKLFLVKSNGTHLFAPKGKYGYFINCAYEPTTNSKTVVSLEGCLSLRSPDGRLRRFQVERQSEITLRGQRLYIQNNKIMLKKLDIEIIGEQAVVFQHEVEHCSAILISDIGKELVVWWSG